MLERSVVVLICRVCGSKMIDEQVVPVKDNKDWVISTEPKKYKSYDMVIFFCENCTHRQIEYVMDESYYEEHDSIMEGKKQYYGDLDSSEKYICKLKKYIATGDILDVGCGQGDFLRVASKYFNTCCGIEPSKVCYENRFEAPNVEYINSYFSQELSLGKYDAVVSFQVLEHVTNVNGFVKSIYNCMKDDAVGMINVPNGNDVFIKPHFHQIVIQHVNYFSLYSLVTLLHKNGFDILEIDNDINTCELTVYFSKHKKSANIQNKVDSMKADLRQKLKSFSVVTVWGAGGRAASYLSLFQEFKQYIKHIVDSDCKKIGGYVYGLDIKIEKPIRSNICDSQVVVILASAYNQEIIDLLRNTYQYSGEVIYFHDDIVYSEKGRECV